MSGCCLPFILESQRSKPITMKALKNLSKLLTSSKIDPKPVVPENAIKDIGEMQFKKKDRFYVTSGPMLYISRLLYYKGPLTSNQLWSEYVKDKQS